ncbi:hypothetical protein COMA2_80107 [Candidatus Nitrospira nitrificans]|uniref:Uncharacterized protein n=1 Tax=Candidatus Nitrospira nitrificans TaxID=1742973 RepID=A0A0S4LRR0_9BACT|nr:hypothetical protein COMA2_80107 [Candidatus Nitrospira nitrificans]
MLVDLWTDDRLATHHPSERRHVRARRHERCTENEVWVTMSDLVTPGVWCKRQANGSGVLPTREINRCQVERGNATVRHRCCGEL